MEHADKSSRRSKRKATQLPVGILSQAIEQTADIVLITDHRGRIEYVNPAFECSTGFSAEEAVGCTPSILHSGEHDADFYRDLWAIVAKGGVFRGILANRKKDGSVFFEEKTITPLMDAQGQITHYVSTGKDVTEQINAQKRLKSLAFRDSLTKLPNRMQLRHDLIKAIKHAKRRNENLAVLFLDLDRFKHINDSLGHDAGDKLLKALAKRLRHGLRMEDTVARTGGDEFIILLRGPIRDNEIARVCRKILTLVTAPVEINRQQQHVDVSIGVSIYPKHHQTHSGLLRGADMAMYHAKAGGGSCFRVFSPQMEETALERAAVESCIRQGLAREEFINLYQPQYDLTSGELVGVEALVRWQHPGQGLVTPDRFISVAEETGDIVPMGLQVLRNACRQMVEWRARGITVPQVSVNLSPRQLTHPSLPYDIVSVLNESGLTPDDLVLELTESALMQQPENAAKALLKVKAMGIKLAIDDFGTGHSSLSHLRRFPFDCVKIDRSFIVDVELKSNACTLVEAIINMAHGLNMSVLAEGVEEQVQLDCLRELGCEYAQGFLLGRPVSADEISGTPLPGARDNRRVRFHPLAADDQRT